LFAHFFEGAEPDGRGNSECHLAIWKIGKSDPKIASLISVARDVRGAFYFSPHKSFLFSATHHGCQLIDIRDNDCQTQEPQIVPEDHACISGTWHPKRDILALGIYENDNWANNLIRLIDADTLQTFSTLTTQHKAPIEHIAWSSTGRYIATGSIDHTAIVYDLETGTQTFLYGHSDRVNFVDFSPDGQRLKSSSASGECILWDPATCAKLAQFPITSSSRSTIRKAWSPDARMIATIKDGAIEVRRLAV